MPYNVNKIRVFKIPIERIKYYELQGEIVNENRITGGGGSNIGWAVVGGVIAGGAGAIIGSRNKIDSIKSELITHDNRATYLFFNDKENKKLQIIFNFNAYKTLNELIPDKAYEIINMIKTNEILEKANTGDASSKIANQIRELAKLKEEGILTDEEFNDKKKSLLEKMV